MTKYIITGESLRQAPILKKDNDFYIGTIYTPLHEASDLSLDDFEKLKGLMDSKYFNNYKLEAIN